MSVLARGGDSTDTVLPTLTAPRITPKACTAAEGCKAGKLLSFQTPPGPVSRILGADTPHGLELPLEARCTAPPLVLPAAKTLESPTHSSQGSTGLGLSEGEDDGEDIPCLGSRKPGAVAKVTVDLTQMQEVAQSGEITRRIRRKTLDEVIPDAPLSFSNGFRRSPVVFNVQASLVHETFFGEGGLDAQEWAVVAIQRVQNYPLREAYHFERQQMLRELRRRAAEGSPEEEKATRQSIPGAPNIPSHHL
eukprot:s407_g10.t2